MLWTKTEKKAIGHLPRKCIYVKFCRKLQNLLTIFVIFCYSSPQRWTFLQVFLLETTHRSYPYSRRGDLHEASIQEEGMVEVSLESLYQYSFLLCVAHLRTGPNLRPIVIIITVHMLSLCALQNMVNFFVLSGPVWN